MIVDGFENELVLVEAAVERFETVAEGFEGCIGATVGGIGLLPQDSFDLANTRILQTQLMLKLFKFMFHTLPLGLSQSNEQP